MIRDEVIEADVDGDMIVDGSKVVVGAVADDQTHEPRHESVRILNQTEYSGEIFSITLPPTVYVLPLKCNPSCLYLEYVYIYYILSFPRLSFLLCLVLLRAHEQSQGPSFPVMGIHTRGLLRPWKINSTQQSLPLDFVLKLGGYPGICIGTFLQSRAWRDRLHKGNKAALVVWKQTKVYAQLVFFSGLCAFHSCANSVFNVEALGLADPWLQGEESIVVAVYQAPIMDLTATNVSVSTLFLTLRVRCHLRLSTWFFQYEFIYLDTSCGFRPSLFVLALTHGWC